MALEGKQIDRYHIQHLLGSGGMGDVYLAEDQRIGQQVAIKVIRTEISPYPDSNSPKDAARLFQREAKAIVKLDHPNILPLYDYGEERIGNMPIIYLVMPYRQEGSLADWLRRREKTELLFPQDVVHIVRQAADALQHAHDHQVIHQDVKPSNFLIRTGKETPTRPDLLLADFGIARLSSATSSVSQSVRGTPSYMAPEQWEGESVPSTDQYALAVMAYELLVGKLPFQGGPGKMMYQHLNVQPRPPSTLNPGLSRDIDTVLLHALAKSPERRFASISAFANAFHQAVQGIPPAYKASSFPNSKIAEKTALPAEKVAMDTSASTIPNSSTQPMGDDAETYVKPIKILESLASALSSSSEVYSTEGSKANRREREGATKGGSSLSTRADIPTETNIGAPNLAALVNRTLHTGKRRPILLAGLIILILALLSGGIAYALPFLLRVSFAKVAITPMNTDLKNTYVISAVKGSPDVTKHQVAARLLSFITQPQTRTIQVTGLVNTPGTHATGILTLDNYSGSPVTVYAGTVYQNQPCGQTRIGMILNTTITAPASSNPGIGNTPPGTASAPAYVAQVGTIGNIPATNSCVGFASCVSNCGCCNQDAILQNYSPFSGGQDPQHYTFVQQQDIDGVAQALTKANMPANPQQMLQPQLHSNERFIASPQCKQNVTSDHVAGDQAASVTVSVSFTCTGEVYNYNGVQSMASQLLHDQAAADLGSNYLQVGNIATTLTKAMLTDAKTGTITLMVAAQGTWVYQFTDAQKQALAKLIAGKKKSEAQTLLSSQTGVVKANVQVSGGDGDTLPTDISKITITVQNSNS